MSGIFLIVWDGEHEDKTKVLKTTKGGYPHITLAYTGKHVPFHQLIKTSTDVFNALALQMFTLTRAYVNSFTDAKGNMRHDVLLQVEEKDMIENARTQWLRNVYANSESFSMHNPHVTYGIYETQDEAQAVCGALVNYLPQKVQITGVTID